MLKLLPVLCLLLSVVSSRDMDDLKLQESFKGLTGDLGTWRDTCFVTASIKIEDLREYEKGADIPVEHLCFYKCFYEKVGILGDDGQLNGENFSRISDLMIETSDMERTKECLGNVGIIQSCEDMRKLETCFDY